MHLYTFTIKSTKCRYICTNNGPYGKRNRSYRLPIFRDFPPFRVLSGCPQVRLSALDALDSRESRAAGELQVFDVW